jgi:hypothetical protein
MKKNIFFDISCDAIMHQQLVFRERFNGKNK